MTSIEIPGTHAEQKLTNVKKRNQAQYVLKATIKNTALNITKDTTVKPMHTQHIGLSW